MTDEQIAALVDASRYLIARVDTPCGCRKRVRISDALPGDPNPLWHLCDYHEGYEDGLRLRDSQ